MTDIANRSVVLCSGGLDSVVAAAHWQLTQLHTEILLLHIDYGSRANHAESKRVADIAQRLGITTATIETDVMQWMATAMMPGANVTHEELKGEAAWVPGRNLLLCSIAASWAVVHDARYVVIGNIKGGAYADNQPEFVSRLNYLAPYALGPNQVEFCAPLNEMEKHEVVHLGKELRVPFELTWSCYFNGHDHCGKCGSCVSRRNAFAKVGIEDPVKYAN
jgi:7-cyano-7-deazaguanine synthase